MATKTTHTFKTVDSIDLKVDIYTRTSDIDNSVKYNTKSPVILFIHGGGFVAFDREHLGPSIIQSALKRSWPLVSTDYRKLPQVRGKELLEDVKDAYSFVREDLPGILAGTEDKLPPFENIIVVGQSAGGYLALLCGHFKDHRPIAILSYYGVTTTSDDMFKRERNPAQPKIPRAYIAHFLDEEASVGSTPPHGAFHPESLLADLSRNPDFIVPASDESHPSRARQLLAAYFAQEKMFASFMEDVDRDLEDPSWRDYVPTIFVHGEADAAVPLQASVNLAKVIGPTPVKLFVAKGANHAFDEPLYLGDPEMAAVEEGWAALEEVVNAKLNESA
ncbi:Alpha/Beta hydrolase protein [Leptodontidium sp. MPI-SDFR-AT-0119]|nr:Alpha/Beta hydrolase protein [Leptodontidium sp. MPI-SDFR-AT-0119]